MKSEQTRDSLWISLIKEWEKPYRDSKHILTYLNSYPKILSTLKIGELHNPISLDDSQIEWIWLCSKFDNPVESEFFKPYWIPIEVNSYDYFIDISDEKFPIFDIHFFFYEPFRWYKKFLCTDIKDILLAPDTGLDLRIMLDKNDKIRWNKVDEFFEERRRLGFEGKIYVEPVNKHEIVSEDSKPIIRKLQYKDLKIIISEVTSIIAGLLPYDLRVDLKYIQFKYGKPKMSIEKVRIIRDLVFFLRDAGIRRVDCYRIDFPRSENCFLEFSNESCVLHHTDSKILIGFSHAVIKLSGNL